MLDRFPQTILESASLIPLPTLPQVLVRFLALLEDEYTPLKDLATLVARDPAFAARILTIANSTPYRQEPVAVNLEQSLSALGRPLLRTLASCMTVQNVHAQSMYERNFDYPGFWCHSLRVAAMAGSLADAVGYRDAEEAYLAGLLHDIGQLLLVGGAGEFCDMLPRTNGLETGVAGVAQTLSGIDHALVGARLADSWQLPSFLADAILFHQFPAEQIASADLLCRIVWSAHRLSALPADIDDSFDGSPDLQKLPPILGIDAATITNACRTALTRVEGEIVSLGVQDPAAEKAHPGSRFIYPHVSLPKRNARDGDRALLEDLVRNQAVMQPLQESLFTLASEQELYGALRETARLLFGLHRPVFLFPHPEKPVLVVAACAGQPTLLDRLEFPLESGENLAASAFRAGRPCSSFDDEGTSTGALPDIQLVRLLGSQGLLCIPMNSGARTAGVMVFGLSAEQYACKLRLFPWLAGFAKVAARSLEMFRALHERDQRIAAELGRQFEQKARKVIHEAVNPLGIINNYLKIFADKLGETPDVRQELTILKEEISRVERIVRSLNVLPEQAVSVETVNVNNLIEGMMALYGESLFELRGIEIDKKLASGLPEVRADRDSLKQILFNLWKNSAEAMPTGGSFRIVTRGIALDDDCCGVEICLSDSGPGIPPDVMARLFQPLPPDRRPANSGVGLSIVASLVERLGGQISCDSSPGEGTTFTIRLVQARKEGS